MKSLNKYFILISSCLCILLNSCATQNNAIKCPSFGQKIPVKLVTKQDKKIRKVKVNSTIDNIVVKELKQPIFTISKKIDVSPKIETIKSSSVRVATVKKELPWLLVRKIPDFYTNKIIEKSASNSPAKRRNKPSIAQKNEQPKQLINLEKDDKDWRKQDPNYNKKARIGGILGIFSLILLPIPVMNFLCIPMAITGLILTARRLKDNESPRTTKVGFIISIITLSIITIAIIAAITITTLLTYSNGI